MTPNLYVALRTAVDPRLWHRSQRVDISDLSPPESTTEHRDHPVPGTYQYKQNCGWYLVCRDSDPDHDLHHPDLVLWNDALNGPILASDYARRHIEAPMPDGVATREEMRASIRHNHSQASISSLGSDSGYDSRVSSSRQLATLKNQPKRSPSPSSSPSAAASNTSHSEKPKPLISFVQLDDGVTYVNDKDEAGRPTKGPWQRFVIDEETGQLRLMRKKDDPSRRSANSSLKSPIPSKVATPIGSNVVSRRTSAQDLVMRSVDDKLKVPSINAAVAQVAKEKRLAEMAKNHS